MIWKMKLIVFLEQTRIHHFIDLDMKYIDAEKLKVLLSDLKENHKHYKGDFHEGVVFAVNEIEEEIEEIINSFQQETSES